MPSNIKNRTIPKYTSQTNSHKGYTIEELRRLFSEGKQITSENLTELINQCFNYELVSGEGIRIIELKNNNFKNNTTKTYKLECTVKGGGGGEGSGSGSGGGSGSGHCNVKADYGVRFGTADEPEIADKDTVVADLYDYTLGPSIGTTGVYPVSLSDEGKLIVDMSISKLECTVYAKDSTSNYSKDNTVLKFTDTICDDHFKFNIKITGSKIVVTGIKTIIDGVTRTDYDDKIAIINDGHHNDYSWTEPCSYKINENNPNQKVVRSARLEVSYTIKGAAQTPAADDISTTFVHAMYYGYTCAYMLVNPNPAEKSPDFDRGDRNRPCFKVYSSHSELYEDGRRTGAEVTSDDSGYKVTILNTETNISYILGYFDIYNDRNQQGAYTSVYVGTNPNNLQLGSSLNRTFYYTILLPEGLGTFSKIMQSNNDNTPYDALDTFVRESVKIADKTYYQDHSPLYLNYYAYTLGAASSISINSIKFNCTIS